MIQPWPRQPKSVSQHAKQNFPLSFGFLCCSERSDLSKHHSKNIDSRTDTSEYSKTLLAAVQCKTKIPILLYDLN